MQAGSRAGAVAPQGRPIHCSPFPLGVPHQANREPDSSPRHIARSVRISRTTRSCTLPIQAYASYQTGATAETDGTYDMRYSEKSPNVPYSQSLLHRFQPKPRRWHARAR
jgi:hypothetical protein